MPQGIRTEERVFQKLLYMKTDVTDQFGEGTVTLDLLYSGTRVTGPVKMRGQSYGDHMVFLQRTAGPKNVAVGQSSGQMHARPGQSQWRRSKWRSKRLSAAVGFEELAVYRERGGNISFDERMSAETSGLVQAIRKRMSINLLGDASAMYAKVASSGSNWNNSTNVLTVPDGNKFANAIGTEVILRNPTTGALPGSWPTVDGTNPAPAYITAVSGNTITLTQHDGSDINISSSSAFDGFGIYEFDNQGGQLWGLRNHCGATNPQYHGFDPDDPGATLDADTEIDKLYGGIDRNLAANADWKALSFAASDFGSTDFGIKTHLRPIMNRIQDRIGGHNKGDWWLAITGNDVWDRAEDELSRGVENDYTFVLRGGHEALAFRNCFIVKDPDAVPSDMLIFDPESIFRLIEEDWHVDDSTGSINRVVQGYIPGRTTQQFTNVWVYIGQGVMSGRCIDAAILTGLSATN